VVARRHLALVGLPGTGKSTIGRIVARRLSIQFVDLDALIVEREGRSIPDLFAADGETGFRDRETEALRDTLGQTDPVLLSCGGGVVLAAENRSLLMESARIVWLTAPLGLLADRLRRSSTERPLLKGDMSARLAALAAEREPLYLEVADLVVDVSGQPAEVVEDVLSAVGERAT
jgi:shikimate kinase